MKKKYFVEGKGYVVIDVSNEQSFLQRNPNAKLIEEISEDTNAEETLPQENLTDEVHSYYVEGKGYISVTDKDKNSFLQRNPNAELLRSKKKSGSLNESNLLSRSSDTEQNRMASQMASGNNLQERETDTEQNRMATKEVEESQGIVKTSKSEEETIKTDDPAKETVDKIDKRREELTGELLPQKDEEQRLKDEEQRIKDKVRSLNKGIYKEPKTSTEEEPVEEQPTVVSQEQTDVENYDKLIGKIKDIGMIPKGVDFVDSIGNPVDKKFVETHIRTNGVLPENVTLKTDLSKEEIDEITES